MEFPRLFILLLLYLLLNFENWNRFLATVAGEEEENMMTGTNLSSLKVYTYNNGIDKEHEEKHNSMSSSKTCALGQFGCSGMINSSICIPQHLICNGKSDCPDSSDEKSCHNHHERDYWDSVYRKRMDEDIDKLKNKPCKYKLYNLKITSSNENDFVEDDELQIRISLEDYETFISKCRCVNEKLFCQNLKSISTMLPVIPKEVEFLDLSGSPFSQVDFSFLMFPELKTLILSSCFIHEIPLGAFSHLEKLRILFLTNNHLTSIPKQSFAENKNLQKLFLGHNVLSGIEPESFAGNENLQELDLRNNKLSGDEQSIYSKLKSLRILQLNGNKMKTLRQDYFIGLKNLQTLSLGHNQIDTLENGVFEELDSLQRLYLGWNLLKVLQNDTFCNLKQLLVLNINSNELKDIHLGAFNCLDSLESLNLERNRFGELSEPRLIFRNLNHLRHIYFDQFWMCWWVPNVRYCQPKGDGISSVENLLDNILLRICVWIMGLLGLIGNLFVIAGRTIFREKNPIHSFYIKNLAIADLLMGIFLITIAIHDVKFRGEFLAYQDEWRHSYICKLAGVLCTLSSEASVLILTLITMDRYLSIIRPFAERRKSIFPWAFGIISILWLISSTLSFLPLLWIVQAYFGLEFYTSNGLCLPLQIHNPFDPGWEFSFVLFVIFNSIAFTFICYAYWKMLRIVQSSSTTLRTNQQKQDGVLAMRFGLVVVTDFACWFPVIIAKALAMAGVSIPSSFYAWLAVFVLPVNSSLNPILYTLTTKLFKQRLSKVTTGFRKRFHLAQMDDSTASFSFLYRATRRTTTTSMGNSIGMGRGSSSKLSKRGANTSRSSFGQCTQRQQQHQQLPLSHISRNNLDGSLSGIPISATAIVHPINSPNNPARLVNGTKNDLGDSIKDSSV